MVIKLPKRPFTVWMLYGLGGFLIERKGEGHVLLADFPSLEPATDVFETLTLASCLLRSRPNLERL